MMIDETQAEVAWPQQELELKQAARVAELHSPGEACFGVLQVAVLIKAQKEHQQTQAPNPRRALL